MRIISFRSVTKIFPSPIFPVPRCPQNRLDDRLGLIVGNDHLHLGLGEKIDRVFGAAVLLLVPFLAAETAAPRRPSSPGRRPPSAQSLTSSSLKWRMTASIFFMEFLPAGCCSSSAAVIHSRSLIHTFPARRRRPSSRARVLGTTENRNRFREDRSSRQMLQKDVTLLAVLAEIESLNFVFL